MNNKLEDVCPYHFRNGNPLNKLITIEHINNIFSKFKIPAKINRLETFYQAFVHKSFTLPTLEQLSLESPLMENEYDPNFPNWVPLQLASYERLEFLGDSILGCVITDYIVQRYPKEEEGFLTRLKTQLVRGTNLCILAKKLKFDRYVLLARNYEKARNNNDILEDVLEAFIGALYRDLGGHGHAYEICQLFIINLIERYININQFARRQDNYKDLLLQYFHKHFNGANPRYCLISTYGPTNNRVFKTGIINTDGKVITEGEGSKMVFAEQAAAKEALKYYGVDVYSDSEEPVKELYSDSDSESL